MAKHEYRILSRKTEGGLATVVEEFLDAGWQLVGGVFIRTESEMIPNESGFGAEKKDITNFYQAILRVSHSQPMVAIRGEHEEVVMYSEN